MHSPEGVISLGQLCCSKQAALLCIIDSFWSMRVLPQQNVVKQERKNVELSAEGGIDTAYNSRGGDLGLFQCLATVRDHKSFLQQFVGVFCLLFAVVGGVYYF